jgi:Domain of unknown function (DUF4352)
MSEQMPSYNVGDVANGHVWNGTTWEPVAHGAQGTPPQKPWFKRWWGIALLGLGVLVLLGLVFGGGEDSTPTATTTPPTEQSAATQDAQAEQPKAKKTKAEEAVTEEAVTEEAQPDSNAPGIGDPVRDGKFEFTVTDVETGETRVGNQYLNQKAQGSFTLVTLKVENIGDEPQMFDDSNIEGIDSKDREVSSDSEAGIYANENNEGFLTDINPGNSVTATVVFDLAKGEKLVTLIVHDSAFSDGAEVNLN